MIYEMIINLFVLFNGSLKLDYLSHRFLDFQFSQRHNSNNLVVFYT
ncbi:hypothetical protein PSM36_0589 [Proteiniphilum saccharofermentans]|uniref:Uncharacterized protein n=1 Tax=Proteiniphilum saccharofermentans TaxID=1642647 RepID=A0A1R3SZV9_9BACT|nr:hypothetical protein PSM36_0589 [Proteiniphilum saccharofermentans]SDZ82102.1 hypothetical protein SAMN05216331_10573 [Porphyromonadaceae bacterium KH3R12]SFS30237.1 hypothetical protein SAMN05216365_101134 [Porphyromonadaceae bacterium NLAE-zl-C104]